MADLRETLLPVSWKKNHLSENSLDSREGIGRFKIPSQCTPLLFVWEAFSISSWLRLFVSFEFWLEYGDAESGH